MSKKFKVGIIGASGYTGYELITLLQHHPHVELAALNSTSNAGRKVKAVYPDFKGDLAYTSYSIQELNDLHLDVVFLAVPHGVANSLVPQLNCKVIDLSPDYRFHDDELFRKAYGCERDNTRKAVYGLPELFREDIKKAHVVGNPGCYATGMILSSFPIQNKASYMVFDCKSGWSGAGKESPYAKNPSLTKDNVIAYKLSRHRHKYEVEQFVKTPFSFTPHIIDTFQGMMITAHILLKKAAKPKDIIRLYKKFYRNSPLIDVSESTPSVRDAQGKNKIIIGGFEVDENNQLVIVAVLDNLLKGASGEAVQNMNLMLDLDETAGLL